METEFFTVKQHTARSSYVREYAGSTIDQEQSLQLAVKQYTPKKPLNTEDRHAITVIAAPACGYPKEMYEPLWDELYRRADANGYSIKGIWMMEASNMGDSGVLNEHSNSNDASWFDYSRDLLQMINQFQSQMSRPLVGIGHSFGGASLVHLAMLHPRLLTSLVVLDPVIQRTSLNTGLEGQVTGLINIVLHRRDVWPNRKAAIKQLERNHADFDPRMLKLLTQYCLRELPTALHPTLPEGSDPNDPPVTLKTTKHNDAVTSLRENFPERFSEYDAANRKYRTPDFDPILADLTLYRPEAVALWHSIDTLRPSLLWFTGGKSFANLKDIRKAIARAGTCPGGSGGAVEGRVKEVFLKDHGHLLAFTAPNEVADSCSEWLGSEIKRYTKQEEHWRSAREKRTSHDHLTLHKGWYEAVPSSFPNRKPKL